MRLRRRVFLPAAALLGAAVAVLPAAAASEASIEAPASGAHVWSPSTATINAGGDVKFANASSGVPHGVVWSGGPETPSCKGVPLNEGKTSWSGSCTFSKPGAYSFYCFVHGPGMSGVVTVNANGTTTTTTTTSTTTSTPTNTSSTQSTPPPTNTTSPPPGPGASAPLTPSAGSAVGSPLAGSSSAAVRVASTQRGNVVHGSVAVSAAGAGGRLDVRLLTAAGAGIASAHRAKAVTVGHLLRSSLAAGPLAFVVRLDAGARRALRARGRLALVVKIAVTSPHGSAVSVVRHVLLRA